MSHFSVMLIGDDYEGQLAPYHEFECTGFNDKYVIEVDETEKMRKEYEEYRQPMFQGPNGELVYRYDPRFYFPLDAPEFLAYAATVIPDEEKRREVIARFQQPMGLMGMGWGDGFSHSSRDWGDGRGYSGRIHVTLPGWTETERPAKESFATWMTEYHSRPVLKSGETPDIGPEGEHDGEHDGEHKHKFGWVEVDDKGEVVKVVDRTNPRARWDYYRMGGRSAGLFKLKRKVTPLLGSGGVQDSGVSGLTSGEFENLRNLYNESRSRFDRIAGRYGDEKYKQIKAAIIRANVQATGILPEHKKTQRSWDGPPDRGEEYVDQARKGDIDWEAMRAEAAAAAGAAYDHFLTTLGEHAAITKSFAALQKDKGLTDDQLVDEALDDLRKEYREQPGVALAREDRDLAWDLEEFLTTTREEYVQLAADQKGVTFAVVKDGQWYERGKMGWWACVSNEQDIRVWITKVREMIDALPDDTMLTVCDCHI